MLLCTRLAGAALRWRLPPRHPRQLSGAAAPDLRAFIAGNTEPVREHLTPEMSLRLLTPRCRFWSQPAHLWPFSDPYWAIYWPGGQALSRYLLDFPAVTRSKRVLDVGSGCGASAIAASMSGASHVLANDIDPVAAVSIQMNCELNKIPPLLVATESLVGKMEEKWDVILLGDMFYDEELAASLHNWLTGYKQLHGSEILIGDPGRSQFTHYAAQNCLQKVIEYELPETSRQENYGLTSSSVWRFLSSDITGQE
ncbi:electron transfer flavoprotein beta subunit lysine methyltransferase [Hemiscyllium ocellatum]|uniref:electron transfer flavoprotein beta subunit lysine methyltransferase n=1 Tax=Hemiscyllium ocellatum TaxID=170820 RepID=UPI0029663A04|nr:electron transfer flavoprotein beta subunit lysine methyltransferase [Hemiscyllium ocellatum]